MKKTSLFILLACITILMLPMQVLAGFGISPSIISNENLKPGSSFSQEFVISRSDPYEEMEASITSSLGPVGDWLSFNSGNSVLLPAGEERVRFEATVTVPADASTEAYDGFFTVTATPKDQTGGVAVVKGARVEVLLAMTDADVVDYTVRMAVIPDAYEAEDMWVNLTIQNDGNTAASPSRVDLEVQDLHENNVTDLTSTEISEAAAHDLSETTATFHNHGLMAGDYYGLISIYEDESMIYEDRVVFTILPEKVYEEVCTGASESMVENQDTYMYVAMAAGVAIAGIALLIVLRKKEDEKKTLKVIIVVGGLLVYLGIVYVAIGQDYFDNFTRTCTEQLVVEEPMVVEEVTTETVEEDDVDADVEEEVQGVAVSETETLVVESEVVDNLRVGLATEDGKYRVYEDEDLSSEVIYLAEEGEELNVIEEKASWYRVVLEDGSQGWLPMANTKIDSE